MLFTDLNLNKSLIRALDDLGLKEPTHIQIEAFSPIMSGRDVIGLAQTGTGKTYAYLLPILRQWRYSKDRFPQILIVVPTRELVVQVLEEIEKLTTYMNVVVVGSYGGANIKNQVAEIEKGLDIVVSTPGRLLDLCLKGALKLKSIKKFVIDEVDEMLNLGFLPQLKRVIDLLPKKRQNLLFSATMTKEVEKIIFDFFNSPIRIQAAPIGTPLKNIQQSLYYVRNFNTKINLLRFVLSDAELYTKVLVFISTKKLADLLFESIHENFEEKVGIIHSNKSQNFRFNAVNNFVKGDLRILIATDIVARGIDVTGVSHVFNFDLPEEPENYIHRIGRTGRADKVGRAISFCTENEEPFLMAIESLMKYAIPLNDFPQEVDISDVLIDEELPKIKMKNVVVPRAKKTDSQSAFHEKKEKNKKVNQPLRRADKMKLKYKKPQTRGMKKTKKKK